MTGTRFKLLCLTGALVLSTVLLTSQASAVSVTSKNGKQVVDLSGGENIPTLQRSVATAAEIAEYNKLVDRTMGMDDSVDFRRLRELYVKLPSYKPYAVDPIGDGKILAQKIEEKNPQASQALAVWSRNHIALPQIHSTATALYYRLNDKKSFQYEMWLTGKLLDVLTGSGDGKTPQTAFKVIIVPEEYLLARHILEKVDGQRLENKDGHVFDVLNGRDKNGQSRDIWYNIDPIWATGI